MMMTKIIISTIIIIFLLFLSFSLFPPPGPPPPPPRVCMCVYVYAWVGVFFPYSISLHLSFCYALSVCLSLLTLFLSLHPAVRPKCVFLVQHTSAVSVRRIVMSAQGSASRVAKLDGKEEAAHWVCTSYLSCQVSCHVPDKKQKSKLSNFVDTNKERTKKRNLSDTKEKKRKKEVRTVLLVISFLLAYFSFLSASSSSLTLIKEKTLNVWRHAGSYIRNKIITPVPASKALTMSIP